MTFRKPGRPYRYTAPTLPGFGRVGPWSTGTASKRLADAVEEWLRRTALSDPMIVRAIIAGRFSLREAYVADKEDRLSTLRERLTDPPLAQLIQAYERTQDDRRKLDGLRQLREAIPNGARLSWLKDAKHITHLLTEARAAGKKTNSVHRSLYAAIKGLLSHEVGEAEKRRITGDVQFSYEDDTRHVDLSAGQIRTLLGALDVQMYDLAVAAMLTGIDRGPLLRLTPSSFDFDSGTVRVHDTKARSRQRMLEMSEEAATHFRRMVAGVKEPGALIFSLSGGQVGERWAAMQRATGLRVRFKDLRHVFANAWVDEGGSLHELGQVLGHTRNTTTLRYTAREARRYRERMGKVAARLGMARHHIRATGSE